MWRGRTIIGAELLLGCSCDPSTGTPASPDSAVMMKVYANDGTLMFNNRIPPLDKFAATGIFAYMLPITSAYSVGRYVVRYSYAISGITYVPDQLDVFEVVDGGDNAGQFLSLFYLDRPDGQDFILGQTEQGSLTISRGPQV